MKRLFAFGCGFTNYYWPTWAEMLAYDLDIPLYNYGKENIDNKEIFNSLMQADNFFNFNENDIVVVQWNHSQSVIDILSFIKSSDCLLTTKKCEYYFISSAKVINDQDKKSDQYKKIITNFSPHLLKLKKSFQEVPFIENKDVVDPRFKSEYPSPMSHINYFERIFWKLNPKSKTSLQKICLFWTGIIKENCSKNKCSLDKYSKEDLEHLKKTTVLHESQPIFRIW